MSSRLDELANRTDQLEQTPSPRDCSDIPAGSPSGIYTLQLGLDRSQSPVAAYCDLDKDGGGWTVIQRRADIEPRQDFNLYWPDYRRGFGNLSAEFWWGLEKLQQLTSSPYRQYELLVNLADFDGGRRHATYRQFRVASEAEGYRLFVADYTGDAGDSLRRHSGQKFSTKDRDQDKSSIGHCAQALKGGWWFDACYDSNLNGPYLSGQQVKYGGVIWHHWRGDRYSLKETEMKIRPVNTD